MGLSEADAARERAHHERARKRVAALLGSGGDRASRGEPGARSEALADAFAPPPAGSSRTLQDVVDEYAASRWRDRLGLARGFEHVRELTADGSWGEQVACARELYRGVDDAVAGDGAFRSTVAAEIGALASREGCGAFFAEPVDLDAVPRAEAVLECNADGTRHALPRFPAPPAGGAGFDAEAWDGHLASASGAWADRQREAFASGEVGAEAADRAIRDGYLALRAAAFASGGAHYSSRSDEEPPAVEARGRDEGPSPAGAPASAAGREGRGEEGESLARRLAGSGDRAEQVVCTYIVECFEAAVGKAVRQLDRRLAGYEGRGADPGVSRAVARELEEAREGFRRDVDAVRDSVVAEVREALGGDYRLDPQSRTGHREAGAGGGGSDPVARARAEFRRDADAMRRESVGAVHEALGGGPELGRGAGRMVPPLPEDGAPAAGDAARSRFREARAEHVGTPRAVVLGHITEASLMVAAAKGPESLSRMAELVERSPARQAGLETVGCDPLLAGLAAGAGQGGPAAAGPSALGTLAGDLGERHLARCREDPAAAERDELSFARTRAALRSGPCAAEVVPAERGYGAACRVEIDSRLGRVPSKLPREGDLRGVELSLEGRAWLDRMRGRSVVPEAAGPDRAVVPGAGRGAVRSFLGRRAQGFDRVVQLAGTRRGRAAGVAASRLLAWGTRGGSRRLRAAGMVLGSSKHLMAGLVGADADPVAVAAASSPGAARALAAGRSGSLADGSRPADHRRLVQVAEELDRRQRREELTPETSAAARAARLERWSRYRAARGPVPELLKELHGDRHQAITASALREKDRAVDARRSGDRDFDLVRERVRDSGVRVWAQAWRGSRAFDGRDWRFDGKRTHPDGVPRPGGGADGVKAMLAVSGASVRHGADTRLRVGKDLGVEVPEGLNDEERQSALIYGAARAIVVSRNPTMVPGNRESLVLSGMLASRMARELDATYEPPDEVRGVEPSAVGDDVLRKGNALVQEVGAQVQGMLASTMSKADLERHKEIDHQVDFIARHSFGEGPQRAEREGPARGRSRGAADAGRESVDLAPGRG